MAVFTDPGEYTLASQNETGQNTTTAVLNGVVNGIQSGVQMTLVINNSSVGIPLGQVPFAFGHTYSVVITQTS